MIRLTNKDYCLADFTEHIILKNKSIKPGSYNQNNPRIEYLEDISTRAGVIYTDGYRLKKQINELEEITHIFICSYDIKKSKVDSTWTIQWNYNNLEIVKQMYIEKVGRYVWIEFHCRLKGDISINSNF
jgi:hypothetical protein